MLVSNFLFLFEQKMSEILHKRDISFPDFIQKCVNYTNFKSATKQDNSSIIKMFNTALTSITGWVTLPQQVYITQPSIILPLTALESTIKNIFAIRDTKTRMFRSKFYQSQE